MSFPVPRTAAAVVLLIAGLVALGLWRIVGGAEAQPFAPGAQPPMYVRVTGGQTYSVAVPGGVPALLAAGVPLSSGAGTSASAPDLECDWNLPGLPPQALRTTAESQDTKATEVVGSFVAPVTGRLHIDCQHEGTVFVPDADNASGDPSGWFLVVSAVLLLLGGAAALSSGWAHYSGRTATAANPDPESDPDALLDVGELAVEDSEDVEDAEVERRR